MDLFHGIINSLSFALNIIGSIIILYGVVMSLAELIKDKILAKQETVELLEKIRIKLGSYLVLGIEFFVAGDIVKTIITPTWESLGILGAIVVIRTILSYFLTKDIKKA